MSFWGRFTTQNGIFPPYPWHCFGPCDIRCFCLISITELSLLEEIGCFAIFVYLSWWMIIFAIPCGPVFFQGSILLRYQWKKRQKCFYLLQEKIECRLASFLRLYGVYSNYCFYSRWKHSINNLLLGKAVIWCVQK